MRLLNTHVPAEGQGESPLTPDFSLTRANLIQLHTTQYAEHTEPQQQPALSKV